MVFVFLSGVACVAHAEDFSFLSSLLETSLSSDKKCPAQPTIYCSPRYLHEKTGKGQDLRDGLSAKRSMTRTTQGNMGFIWSLHPNEQMTGIRSAELILWSGISRVKSSILQALIRKWFANIDITGAGTSFRYPVSLLSESWWMERFWLDGIHWKSISTNCLPEAPSFPSINRYSFTTGRKRVP